MMVYAETKECGNSSIQSPQKASPSPSERRKNGLTLVPFTASPPPPLRMERGVDSIIYKQRGRFFTSKGRPFHCKETPSSN